MNAGEENERELGGDDALAAEYVLGVLNADERAATGRRIDGEHGFAGLVDSWEVRLAPLAAAYRSVEPPVSVREGLERRLFGARRNDARPAMWTSLAFWRGLTVAAFAALAVAVAVPMLMQAPEQPKMVASLAAEGSAVRYVAIYDPERNEVGLSHLAGERAAARDFELWMIAGQGTPKSLGVIPVGATAHIAVPADMRDTMGEGMVFAISLEPSGGSPTGAPTGPVVAAGDLRGI